MEPRSLRPKVRASVLLPGGTKFGEGRAELLRLVGEEGSLRGAVKRMGMSYRAAWGYVRELEAAAGFPFLERAGTGPAAGARLTAAAREFLGAYDAFRARLLSAADAAFAKAFADVAVRAPAAPRRGTRRRQARRLRTPRGGAGAARDDVAGS